MRVLAGTRPRWDHVAHWVGGAMLALLCGKFALNAYDRWTQTGSVILAGLVLYNTLLVAMIVTRRPSASTTPRLRDWVAALLTVAISFQFRAEDWRQTGVQAAGVILQ